MINPDTLKRLAKGVDDKRTELMCIHVKDTYAEVTDGKMLIRETVDGAQKEAYLEPETFQPVEVKYPDTASYLQTSKTNPTLYKIGLAPNVLRKFLSVMPKDAEQINFEIKGVKAPIYFECGKLEGLIMPMAVEEISKPSANPTSETEETPRLDRSITKITVVYSDGKEESLTTAAEEAQVEEKPAKEEPAKQPAPVEATKEPAKVPEKPAEKKPSPLPLKTAQKKEAPLVLEANLL